MCLHLKNKPKLPSGANIYLAYEGESRGHFVPVKGGLTLFNATVVRWNKLVPAPAASHNYEMWLQRQLETSILCCAKVV